MRIDNLKFHTRIYMISLRHICTFRRNEKMSQSVDLLTLVEIYKTDHSLYNTFCDIKDISLKEQEIKCIMSMLSNFQDDFTLNNLRRYSVGYKIEQIGKEFDLLRIDNSMVINIELKSELDIEKILNQSRRNYYYLKFIRSNLSIITFELTSNSFYKYDFNKDQLLVISIADFKNIVNEIEDEVLEPSNVFVAKNYLVSPFNSSHSFLSNEYFLTNQQEDIIRLITRSGNKKNSIEGSAGTGKTLLVYHLAKIFISAEYDVRIIHCGQLNEGQIELNKNGFNISSIKNYQTALSNLSSNSVIIIDESQRLSNEQTDYIVEISNQFDCYLFFSFDKMQVLSTMEEKANVTEKIANYTSPQNSYKLTKKIRTNAMLSDFILCLLDKNNKPKYSSYSAAVEYSYVSSFDLAKGLATTLTTKGWTIINPTASRFNREIHDSYCISSAPSAHAVIGQEYDNVAIIIPSTYHYSEKGQLLFKARSYYKAEKMFYQAISRTRIKLHLIIVENPIILQRLMELNI